MASYELDCVTCGGPSTAARKDAQKCHPCRVLFKLEYTRSKHKRPKKCMSCEAKFRPAHEHDRSYCAACEARRHGNPPPTDTACVFCRAAVPPWATHRSICPGCMKDPERQDKIVVLLVKQQQERQQLHADKIPHAPNLRKVT